MSTSIDYPRPRSQWRSGSNRESGATDDALSVLAFFTDITVGVYLHLQLHKRAEFVPCTSRLHRGWRNIPPQSSTLCKMRSYLLELPGGMYRPLQVLIEEYANILDNRRTPQPHLHPRYRCKPERRSTDTSALPVVHVQQDAKSDFRLVTTSTASSRSYSSLSPAPERVPSHAPPMHSRICS